MPLRLIFMGTPDFAVPTLLALADAGHEIAAVYTRAAKPGGRRGLELVPSPVEREAKKLGVPVLTPATLKNAEAEATFRAHNADAAVVIAYGLILPKPILDAPRAWLLQRARLAVAALARRRTDQSRHHGRRQRNRHHHHADGRGARHRRDGQAERVPIGPDMTAGDLHDVLAQLGADLMARALAAAERSSLTLTPQGEAGVTYAAKIGKDETRIDWAKAASQVHDHIRGLSPFPGAWFEIGGVRIKALRSTMGEGQMTSKAAPGMVLDERLTIGCGDGAVRLLQVQRAGKQPMSADEFLRGTPVKAGTRI